MGPFEILVVASLNLIARALGGASLTCLTLIRNEPICRLCQATNFCNQSSTFQKHSGRQGAASHIPFWPSSSPCRGRILPIAANPGGWGIVLPRGKYGPLTPEGQGSDTPLPY